jgi:hypothetical protein
LAAVGCGQATTPCIGDNCNGGSATNPDQPAPGATSFESDLPANTVAQSGSGPVRGAADAANGAAVPATTATTPPPGLSVPGGTAGAKDSSASGDNAELDRMISEADIIQMDGDTLYALSRQAGLGIIDASNPSALKLLGRYRELPAEPFEMYLRDGVALVMFTGWGQYVKTGDSYSFVSTSKLLALDVKDPAHVAQIGSFDVPGSISDSRLVGDVIYIVSYENGYCYDCMQNQPRTSITSLSVADPHAVQKVDQLFYGDTPSSQYGGGPKSITVTTQRMYVAGPEYGPNMPIGSTVQVVDISDPKGDLVEGAHVQVGGQINSRWQMDEYDGVLRVVSQPLQWWSPQGTVFSVPTVETFKIESSNNVTPLGKTDIELPQPESLRSARFDGERAYVITAQQTDPLFTLDLSDPTAPKQVGSVMLPGYIWHMQPRGDRLLAIGFEQGNQQGSIVASLFDVSALATPKLLSQARFGGSWGNLPEDQDRADKVIRVFDDANLLLVPFSGWQDLSTLDNAGAINCKRGGSLGGVELIDFQGDTLKARGAAKTDGQARRGFLQHDQLLSVSDESVQAFDIGDRDNPKQTSEVAMARQVWQARQLDSGAVARFSYDSTDGTPTLDLARTDAAGEPNESLSQVDLSQVGGMSGGTCPGNLSIQQVLVEGSQLDLLYQWYSSDGTGKQQNGLLIIDASKPEAPKIVSDSHWDNQDWSNYYGYYNYGFYNTGDAVVRTDHAIAVLEVQWVYTPISSMQNTRLRVMDMRDPTNVKSTTLPLDLAMYSGLIAAGDTLLTSHLVPTSNNVARGKFYVDRFDLSDPSAPKKQGSVNVPGALIAYDAASKRAFTSEQQLVPVADLTYDECHDRFGLADWNTPNNGANGSSGIAIASPAAPPGAAGTPTQPVDQPPPPKGQCNGYRQSLHLVQLGDSSATLLDSYQLDEDDQASSASMGDGVVFASIGHDAYGLAVPLTRSAIACAPGIPCGGGIFQPAQSKPSEVLVLGGIAGGDLEVGHLTVDDDKSDWRGFWGTPPVYASGKRALALSQSDAAIIDATNPADPQIVKRVTLIASPSYTDVRNGTALLTLGAQGVQWIPLQ